MNFGYPFNLKLIEMRENGLSDCLLKFKDVSKEYYGNKVLKNINLEVKKGEIHALSAKMVRVSPH